jgi:hypothetical protein
VPEDTPTPPAPAGWWASIPEPVRKYGLTILLWLIFVLAGYLVGKLGGGTIPPPPPPVLDGPPAQDAPPL